MALDPATIWPLLRPAAEALVIANSQAGVAARLPLDADVDVVSSDDGSSITISIRANAPVGRVTCLRIDAQYWDTDGHIVFLIGYSDQDGKVCELELVRLDLQRIGRLPNVMDLRFDEPRTGFYKTTKHFE